MRWYSTPLSFNKGEVTLLAVFELAVAVALHIGLVIYFDSFAHVAVGTLVAPFLLLRNNQSVERGLSYWLGFERVTFMVMQEIAVFGVERGRFFGSLSSFSVNIFGALICALAAVVIRVTSVTVNTALHPLQALQSVPRNWQQLTFCIDSVHLPELLPGLETSGPHLLDLRASVFLRQLKRAALTNDAPHQRVKKTVGYLFLFAVFFGPSLAYRVSFKGISLVYAPLVWIAYRATGSGFHDFRAQIEHVRDNDFETLRRWWAGILLALLAFKAAHLAGFISLSELSAQVRINRLMDLFVLPDQIPPWQISTFVKCVLTFALFWLSGAALFRLDKGEGAWSITTVSNAVKSIDFTRRTLALYNLTCGLYIILVAGFELPLPELGERLLPPFGDIWDYARARLSL